MVSDEFNIRTRISLAQHQSEKKHIQHLTMLKKQHELELQELHNVLSTEITYLEEMQAANASLANELSAQKEILKTSKEMHHDLQDELIKVQKSSQLPSEDLLALQESFKSSNGEIERLKDFQTQMLEMFEKAKEKIQGLQATVRKLQPEMSDEDMIKRHMDSLS